MAKMTRRHAVNPSNPTTWPADLTRPAGGPRHAESGPTCNATIAADASARAATDDGAIAAPLAERPHTEDAPPSAPTNGNPLEVVTPTNTKRHTAVTVTIVQCEQCGHDFAARRPWARFCSAYCRRVAWLARNPERAAELAERDKARYRAHVIGNGGTWAEVD